MSKSGLIINGQFFECDIRSLKIEIQGDVNDLSLDVTNASTTIIGNSNTSIAQVFNGNISDGQFGTIIHNAIINLGAIITSCSLAYSLTSEKLGYAMIPVLLILFFAFLPLLLRLFTFGFYGTFKVNDDK